MRERVRKRVVAGLLLALAVACASRGEFRLVEGEYPGELRPPDALTPDLFCRQHVTAYWRDGSGAEASRGFDAVMQKGGGKLTVVGLDPTGRIGFSIVYDGTAIELENHMPREFPFDPRFVLLDAQRAFYPWLPAETPGFGGEDGTVTADLEGERIRETHAGGRLRERTFERLAADGSTDGPVDVPGILRVEYLWRADDDIVPSEVRLDNGWFGYRLVIETHEARRIEVPEGRP